MLTKSLHTVTSCTAVAMHLHVNSPSASAEQLTRDALSILGYPIAPAELTSDTTVAACVAKVRKALAARS